MKQKRLRFLIFVFLLNQVAFYSFAPLYALFADSFGLLPQMIGFIWSGYSLLTAIFILLMGKLENNQKKGWIICLGYALYSLSSLCFLLVQGPASLMAVLALNAVTTGITFPAYKTMFAKSQVRGKESEEWAWLDASNMLAASVGAAIGGVVIAWFGFDGLFISMAIVQVVAAIIAYRNFYDI